MMAQSKTVKVQTSVDLIMQNVALSLIRDFRENLGEHDFCSDFELAVRGRSPVAFREAIPAVEDEMCVAKFKATYQIQSIFKRYRFTNDLFSDDELVEKAVSGFQDTQRRISAIDFDRLPEITQKVLNYARIYIARVLGEYSDEEHRNLCRFGKRASVGIPARLASEAARWELPLSGSPEQINWFDKEMSQIPCIQDYWTAQSNRNPLGSVYQEICSLKLTLVPKTFKSFRSIMPNTTIGSYMSYGLGEMIRKRLKAVKQDIRFLQEKHRILARHASIRNNFVTADLSSASDSISVALVEQLFPPDWFAVLTQSRIGDVVLPDGSIVHSNTFCTMGIGYTFPLQTLVFLSLLKAIEATLYNGRVSRTISVYGDDLIYSGKIHTHVVLHFQELGFVINAEKTFCNGPFRESCGGDYYRGVDVRPFQPQNGSASVSGKTYEATLYKLINGLLMRWPECEIGWTLLYLTGLLEDTIGAVKIVPGDFPDDSGVRCPKIGFWDFLQNTTCANPRHIGHGVYRFSYLRFKPDEREETRHEPYLWAALRDVDEPVFDYSGSQRGQVPDGPLASFFNKLVGCDGYTSPLITRDVKPIKTFRSNLTGRRLRQQVTNLTISHTGHYTRQNGTSCFEDRR